MSQHDHSSGPPWRNFHGRIKGKGLRKAQQAYLDEDLDRLSVGAVAWDVNPDRDPIDPENIFGKRDIWLEIGFGAGDGARSHSPRRPRKPR